MHMINRARECATKWCSCRKSIMYVKCVEFASFDPLPSQHFGFFLSWNECRFMYVSLAIEELRRQERWQDLIMYDLETVQKWARLRCACVFLKWRSHLKTKIRLLGIAYVNLNAFHIFISVWNCCPFSLATPSVHSESCTHWRNNSCSRKCLLSH